jgi:hypothetical protein
LNARITRANSYRKIKPALINQSQEKSIYAYNLQLIERRCYGKSEGQRRLMKGNEISRLAEDIYLK